MKHPFSKEKSSATVVELNETETNAVAGGMTKTQSQLTLAAFDESGSTPGWGRPIQIPCNVTLALRESGGGTVTTQALGEEGGATTYAMGEEGGGGFFY